jgi:hypothetical protein
MKSALKFSFGERCYGHKTTLSMRVSALIILILMIYNHRKLCPTTIADLVATELAKPHVEEQAHEASVCFLLFSTPVS